MLNKNDKSLKSQKGFTIIELMIATGVFSVILLVVTSGIIRIGQTYYKNIISNKTQENVRTVSEDISRTIQLARGQKRDVAGQTQFCIGDMRYTYTLNQKVNTSDVSAPRALTAEKISPSASCGTTPPVAANVRELLGNNMRLLRFKVDPADADQKTWNVDIRIAYGDDDLLTAYNDDGTPLNAADLLNDIDRANCKSGVAGASFCATAQLDTVVKRRLINNTL